MAQRRSPSLPADPCWYRDAVIYQLHVKAFFDSNNDGVGDFPGLIQRLDYLAELGINAVWLLPFYPSPRCDDGYDISDYRGVHPEYGTIADVRTFIREAHARGIRVITELVINHTSDQHPWFQKARRAKRGSPARDFYVWSDSDKAYAGTRIIFLDTEKSNWTWDEEAKAYYWHRFYSHQPDLNFDNPQVLKSVISVMRFWLDLGVDGLRLDAVPYLVEREGTSSENLPETHAILKHIRKVVDDHYPDRMLLAEANQWPEDIQEYFGAGDECHMVFHFPLMPRMYMAIAQEDRFPITDIIRQTPDAPPGCQWAIFLRNHDELTLEMVTDRERDYLWKVYAADRRARLNLGIRRRLAPLLENDRRRIELMNSLLLTMPGTPILYYGDEIGMGDNIHLGDRDGVRTPMQWSSDRNGGFSRADPASLVLPTIMDPIWGHQAVNVEAQWRNPHSLLNWIRRMLVERSRHQAFGRGTLRLLLPQNRKVLAYLREYKGDIILCVVNVSRSAQAVELDLHEFAGRTPIELLGGTPFPPIGQLTYLLTLPPYGFYWFKLSEDAQPPAWSTATAGPFVEHQTLVLRGSLADSLDHTGKQILETDVLPVYMAGRRWFQQKGSQIGEVRIVAVAPMPAAEDDAAFVDVEVLVDNERVRYALPMAIAWEDLAPAPFEGPLAFARARRARRVGLLTDGFASANFAHAILHGLSQRETIPFDGDEIAFLPLGNAIDDIPRDAEIEWPGAEQSNSSLVVGRRAVIKLFRRVTMGIHPEAEMTRVLTERGFTGTPALIGEVVRRHASGESSALAVVQAYVNNQGDGSHWTHEELTRIVDAQAVAPGAGGPDVFEPYWAFLRALGRRVGEMHAVLAKPDDDPAFAPETVDAGAVRSACAGARAQLKAALKALLNTRDKERRRLVAQLAARRDETLELLARLLANGLGSPRTRIHGDLHLGQVLVSGGDVSIIDFEGEPLKPLDQRRAKRSPMRDVAGMVRSFDYAAGIIERERKLAANAPGQARASELLKQFRIQAERRFLDAYGEGRGRPLDSGERQIVKAFAIEKAAYEIVYEVNNRPDWVDIPLRGLAELLQREPDRPVDSVTREFGDVAAALALEEGRFADPFSYLGPHDTPPGPVVRCFLPGAMAVDVVARESGETLGRLSQIETTGLFIGPVSWRANYFLRIGWPLATEETEDPYSFGPLLGDLDLHLFAEGSHWHLAERFGAAPATVDEIAGVRFAVWAPNARRVAVVGDFNSWDGRRHPMRLHHSAGVWEIFLPRLGPGERYKYQITGPDGEILPLKADPLARATEQPPATASVVPRPWNFHWTDSDWMASRSERHRPGAPMAIYEVHAASWLRPKDDPLGTLNWLALAEHLVPYASELGFTHIELLPIMEHPFGGSWGYQPLSQFAPSARFGAPEEFAHFVDCCHRAGLGVILDWVPGHFPTDPHGLARFDGTPLYEHADPREGFHPDWNTYIYNLGRREVQGFLIASALFWLETFHVDGLRVDAVASLLYRDYSRKPGQWIANRQGGRENLEAIDFLKKLNGIVTNRVPGALMIAEESTAWPGVSVPVGQGGLGFGYKWNMGWMHDTLSYISENPVHRRWHHDRITFGLIYAFSERFILPLSHDEVVHGKGSLYGRVPGDSWQKLATLRAYFAFMWTHPGKKLLFMGGEIGQIREWNHDGEIDWGLLSDNKHAGLQRLVSRLNKIYREEPALHRRDADSDGFAWIVGDDADNSVFAYERRADNGVPLIAIVNMTPVPRHGYRVGVPRPGIWHELLNTDSEFYAGGNLGNNGGMASVPIKAHGREHSIELILPLLTTLVLKLES